MQEKHFERAVQTFAVFFMKKNFDFCRVFQEKKLSTVQNFAALWHEFCHFSRLMLNF